MRLKYRKNQRGSFAGTVCTCLARQSIGGAYSSKNKKAPRSQYLIWVPFCVYRPGLFLLIGLHLHQDVRNAQLLATQHGDDKAVLGQRVLDPRVGNSFVGR